MKDILDKNEVVESNESKNGSMVFSKLSFYVNLMAFIYLCTIFVWVSGLFSKYYEPILSKHIPIFVCISFLGIMMMILSFLTKEVATFYKRIGAILGLFLILFFVSQIVFYSSILSN